MRNGLAVFAVVTLLALVAPARAQFYTPFSAPNMVPPSEAAVGAIGAGVAQQQQCVQTYSGRGEMATVCPYGSTTPQPHR
jgi:hypothetical protein